MPPSVSSEREALLAYLLQQRQGVRNAAYGLSEEQLRARPTKSALTIGGLLKHCALTEHGWVQIMLGHPETADEQAYLDQFSVRDDESLATLLADLDEVGRETEAAVASLDDLGQRVQLPKAPWYPSDPDGFSARWILLHLVEEIARHAGHADIIREHLDGATMYELMAAVEGWPETDWLKPWRPAAGTPKETG
ncbi:DinB family protein [Microlunatus panaciterrae]